MSRIDRLLEIMARLRSPDGGCPWDLEQDFASIAPHTIEEAYEVEDAIRRGDLDDLRSELGDLLLQVVFHAQIARERGAFAFDDVVDAICAKLVERHPHVFGEAEIHTAKAQLESWEAIKSGERARRAAKQGREPSVLDDVAVGLPALTRGRKLLSRARRAGFRWSEPGPALAKLREEVDELAQAAAEHASAHAVDAAAATDAMTDARGRARIEEELGDVLLAAAAVAAEHDLDPETAARGANDKFERRLRAVESRLRDAGRTLADASPEELLRLWSEAKAGE
jgi:ATP diphosphatase